MSAAAASPLNRLSSWLHGASARDLQLVASLADPDSRLLLRRKLFDEIGDFLFAHDLALTSANFELAHAYLADNDPRLVQSIGELLHRHGRLNEALVARLLAQRNKDAMCPERLAEQAAMLEARLGDCLAAIDRSQTSAQDYGTALNVEAANLATGSAEAFERLIGLTREVVHTTRRVEGQLKRTREETNRLKSDLDRARRAAERDHLTGLPNRRCFEARTKAAAGAGHDAGSLCVALCDIDDFKAINDRHGHAAGDRVLKYVARFLKAELGGKVLVARYGGEEFACLFERTAISDAAAALDAVRARLAQRSLVNQETGAAVTPVTFSAGLAIVAGEPCEALRTADLLLYEAKRGGKNRVLPL